MIIDVAVLIFLFILKFKNLETHGQVLLGSTQVRWSTSFLQYVQAFFLSQQERAGEHLQFIFRRIYVIWRETLVKEE